MRYSPLGNGAPAASPDGVCAVLGEQAHIVLLTHNSQDKESSALSISEAVFEPYETKQYNRLLTQSLTIKLRQQMIKVLCKIYFGPKAD